jgi:hypothetical protein
MTDALPKFADITFKLLHQDTGNCRVMYQGVRKGSRSKRVALYALTDATPGFGGAPKLVFMECTADGEPSWEVTMPDRSRFDSYLEPESFTQRVRDVCAAINRRNAS